MFANGAMDSRAYTSSGAVAAPLSPSTAMGDLADRVERIVARTADITEMLGVIGDRVMGPEPENALVDKDAPMAYGTLGLVLSRLDELDRAINRCSMKASRLTKL